MKMNKKFFKISSTILALALIAGLAGQIVFAATLTTIYDRLSDIEQSKSSGVTHYIVFTTVGAVTGSTYSVLKLQFPVTPQTTWCATAGVDLVAVGIDTEGGATALPGTLTAQCVQGNGTTTYDTIYVCAAGSHTWSATTIYGVSVADGAGTTGKLGTPTAANDIKVSVTTGTATACGTPDATVDTGSYALSVLSDSTVGVSATVDPLITFSISPLAIGFGTFSSTTKRYTTADEQGSSPNPPGNGEATVLTIQTNAPNGAIVSGRSKGNGSGVEGIGDAGLYKSSSPANLIGAYASSAVTNGSNKYGIYLKNVTNVLGTLAIDEGFNNDTVSDVAVSTTNKTLASASARVDATVDLVGVAAVASTTTAGSYADVITLTGTGKF